MSQYRASKSSSVRAALLGAVLLTAAPLASAEELELLSWLSGCWHLDNASEGSVEQWTTPAGGTMLGMSRVVKDGKTLSHEFMQIRADDRGLVFIARPSNQEEGSFRAIRVSANEAIFENLEHDFPQRVIYRLSSSSAILARIEGTRDGKLRGVDFPMTKVACEASKSSK